MRTPPENDKERPQPKPGPHAFAWGSVESGAVIVSRPASMADAQFLFDLANDPHTRAMSFSTDPIPWETHVMWLAGVLDDPDRRLWIVETWDYIPMGMERLDVRDGYEVVSLALAPEWRGQGHAIHMINGLCQQAKLPLLAEDQTGEHRKHPGVRGGRVRGGRSRPVGTPA